MDLAGEVCSSFRGGPGLVRGEVRRACSREGTWHVGGFEQSKKVSCKGMGKLIFSKQKETLAYPQKEYAKVFKMFVERTSFVAWW